MTTDNKINKGLDTVMINIIKSIHVKHTKQAWDTVWVVAGDEGVGKSSFNSWLLHYWQLLINGKVVKEDAKHMCLDRQMWVEDLKDAQKYEMSINDETDLYSRRSMDSWNVAINKAYQVIRADGLFSVLTLPSLWDLDTFFRNRRVRGLILVTKRGKYCFWSKERLRKMVEINSTLPYKNYFVVKPTHRGWFSKYNGPFESEYRKNKEEKMQKIRQDLYDNFMNPKEKKVNVSDSNIDRNKTIINLFRSGIKPGKIAEGVGVSYNTVWRVVKDFNMENTPIKIE